MVMVHVSMNNMTDKMQYKFKLESRTPKVVESQNHKAWQQAIQLNTFIPTNGHPSVIIPLPTTWSIYSQAIQLLISTFLKCRQQSSFSLIAFQILTTLWGKEIPLHISSPSPLLKCILLPIFNLDGADVFCNLPYLYELCGYQIITRLDLAKVLTH